jgi:hypothetical protein
MDTMTSSAKPKRKVLGAILVVGLLALVVVIDMKRRAAEGQLAALTMRKEQLTGGNTQENRDLAKKVVEDLGTIMELPKDIEPTVATIVDVPKLIEQNKEFYGPAQNGDQLVIYPTFAVIFRQGTKKIINFAPVQLTQPEAAANGQPAGTPAQ